jgi:hypothetical protein
MPQLYAHTADHTYGLYVYGSIHTVYTYVYDDMIFWVIIRFLKTLAIIHFSSSTPVCKNHTSIPHRMVGTI